MKKLLLLCAIAATATMGYVSASYADDRDPNSLNIEYLYWKAEQSGITYGVSPDALTLTPPAPNTTVLRQNFGWNSGFRLGAAHEFACTDFDLSLQWTRFNDNRTTTPREEVIIATELLGVLNDVIVGGTLNGGVISSQWKLDFNMFDLNLGSTLIRNPYYSINSYIGVKGGWVNQKQKITYTNFINTTTAETVTAQVDETNKFYGIGPKLGVAMRYTIGSGFHFIGDFAAAILYGNSKNPVTQNVEQPTGTLLADSTISFQHNRMQPTTQMKLGLDWEQNFFTCYDIKIGICYEMQYFWNTWRNQNSYIQDIYVTDAGYSDLFLQGVTVQASIGF